MSGYPLIFIEKTKQGAVRYADFLSRLKPYGRH